MIIGITGTIASGKGTVSKYLEETYGFKHLSVRGYLVKELEMRGEDITRENMVNLANELRSKFGPDYIVQELYKEGLEYPNSIIESIRTVGEVLSLKDMPNFSLLAIDAPLELRYERAIERGGITDKITFEEFISEENREMESNDPGKQNLRECILLADDHITNDGSIDDLKEKISLLLYLKKEYTCEFKRS